MSYHDNSSSLNQRIAQPSRPGPVVPLSTLARVYMFAPGHPRLPKGTRYAQVIETRPDGTLVIDAFDDRKKKLGRIEAKYFQTGPVATGMQSPVWWTKTGYFGPIITPESQVGPVPLPPPPAIGSLLR